MADKKRHIRDHFARQTWFRWALLALIVIAEVLGSWLIMSFVVELSLHAAIPHMSYEWVYIVDSYRLWITLLLGCGAIPLARQVLFRNILTCFPDQSVQEGNTSQPSLADAILCPSKPAAANHGPLRGASSPSKPASTHGLRHEASSPPPIHKPSSNDSQATQTREGPGNEQFPFPLSAQGESNLLFRGIQTIASTIHDDDSILPLIELPEELAGHDDLRRIFHRCTQYSALTRENESLRSEEQQLCQNLRDGERERDDLREQINILEATQSSLIQELFHRTMRTWTCVRIKPEATKHKSSPRSLQLTVGPRESRGYPLKVRTEGADMARSPRSDSFFFDRIFDTSSTGVDIYDYVRPLIQAANEGRYVCISVDGQSGTGKSYTLFNGPDAIATRAADHIFAWIATRMKEGEGCTIALSSLEVYNDEIYNLLELHANAKVTIKPAAPLHANAKVTIKPAAPLPIDLFRPVENSTQLKSLLGHASRNRHVGSTQKNKTSSRGHSVTILNFQRTCASTTQTSRLYLVDLAGGESLDGATCAQQVTEGRMINQGRMNWASCTKAKVDGEDCSSKTRSHSLTIATRECFVNHSTFLRVCNISPLEQYHKETITSLNFAAEIRPDNKRRAKAKK